MSEKYYFIHKDDGFCINKHEVLAYMKENNLKKIRVFSAIKDKSVKEYFFCTKCSECGEKFDERGNRTCGKECEDYTPRNGKSGCCKYRTACYSPSEKKCILIEDTVN